MSAGGTKLKPVDKVWLDGELIPFTQAQVHILTHTLHYGVGAFEGIRAYKRPDGKGAIFRLGDHIDRLFGSCHICSMDVPYTRAEIVAACVETMRANKMAEAYLRPLVFLGDGELGLGSLGNPVRVAIAVYEWGAYLGEEGLRRGIRAKVSSFTRGALNSTMSKGKICGQYVNSVLAKREAIKSGYAEAILLDNNGLVAEASGENIFLVRRGASRRRRCRRPSSRASPATPSSRWRASSASWSRSPPSRATRCTSPTRSSSPAPPPS